MTKVDSGGSGLGPSAGVVRGRAGSSGAVYGSGGFGAGEFGVRTSTGRSYGPMSTSEANFRGEVTQPGGSVSLPAYRSASRTVRGWAGEKGISRVRATRALAETVRQGNATDVPKGTTTRSLNALRTRLANNVRPRANTSAKGFQGTFGSHLRGNSPVYAKLPPGSLL